MSNPFAGVYSLPQDLDEAWAVVRATAGARPGDRVPRGFPEWQLVAICMILASQPHRPGCDCPVCTPKGES